jgi:MoxR-like ATPase
LLHAAKAHALVAGRDYVAPDDVKAVAAPVLAHRLLLSSGADRLAGVVVVKALLAHVPVPRK